MLRKTFGPTNIGSELGKRRNMESKATNKEEAWLGGICTERKKKECQEMCERKPESRLPRRRPGRNGVMRLGEDLKDSNEMENES